MLRKLMRYDLENIFKFLIIFYSLAAVFGLLTRLFLRFENSLALDIIGRIFIGATISMICNILINNVMRMWVRFKSNLYGDESYLSHTLPVEKETHYFSKILSAAVTLFVSFLVVGAVLFISFYSKSNLQLIKGLLLPLAQMYDSTILGFLAAILAVLFLELLNILQCGFTGIILGHKCNNSKMGLSVLFGFIVYMASQTAVVGIVFLAALFDNDVMNLFVTQEVINIESLKLAVALAIIAYTLVSVVICLVNIKLFKKGVNID